MVKVGINGFGRIGRLAARLILEKYSDQLELVCINTSGRVSPAGWAHLFQYDTAYGKWSGKVKIQDGQMVVNGQSMAVLGIREPGKIPWGKYAVQIVIESTGVFRREEELNKHLRETVEKVVVAAPAKAGQVPAIVLGVNKHKITDHKILSTASCTTNCAAPVVKVIDSNFGIAKGFLTTIHAYTADQNLQDGSHKDWRRARSAANNIVPTTTGAAQATGQAYSQVKDVFDGQAFRVPVITGSLTDFTFVVKKQTSLKEVNQAFVKAAQSDLKGILGVTDKPLVSSDIIGLELSALVDLNLTKVLAGDLVKVVAWYDNEWGYVNRLVEAVVLLAKNN